ncbi:MAG: DNA-binding protein WhiA [Clostridiales bacterium]|nr:DNA-binding protein WhiA [Clostridiales bacterium]
MAKSTSFSAGVKEELARIYPEKPCCRLAELAAIARMDGTVTVGADGGAGFYIATEYSAVARKVYRLLKDQCSAEAELEVKRQSKLRRRSLYHIRITHPKEAPEVLSGIGLTSSRGHILPGMKKDLVKNKCCGRSYLRGAFLGGGSVSGPDSDYHLELTAGSERLGKDLMALVNRYPGFQAKLARRKQSYLVYLKGSDQIADFLTLIGAHGSLLEFENTRVLKGMKNSVNRLVNCETANLSKTADASIKHVSQIQLIRDRIGLESLEPSLAEVARLRLDNPDISLKEMGEIMTPPLGKSGVNHRLRKISEIADRLQDEPSGTSV